MKAHELLERVFQEIVSEAKRNGSFANRILQQLQQVGAVQSNKRGSGGRRAPSAIDPFACFQESEQVLQDELGKLDIEQLKDIVSEYGMDTARLAMRWKSRERLEELIVNCVASRSRKGDAFRHQSDS